MSQCDLPGVLTAEQEMIARWDVYSGLSQGALLLSEGVKPQGPEEGLAGAKITRVRLREQWLLADRLLCIPAGHKLQDGDFFLKFLKIYF